VRREVSWRGERGEGHLGWTKGRTGGWGGRGGGWLSGGRGGGTLKCFANTPFGWVHSDLVGGWEGGVSILLLWIYTVLHTACCFATPPPPPLRHSG